MNRERKILVVDDDPDFLDFVETVLERDHYKVSVSADEKDALEKLESEKPNLLILDMMMTEPDSGLALMWDLKANKRYESIPVLMVTAADRRTYLDLARRACPGETLNYGEYLPVKGCFHKPVKAEELLNKVGQIFGTRREVDSMQTKNMIRSVLIVDPDPVFVGDLSALLSSQGYEVETTGGIRSAVQRLKDVCFCCVIMDEDLMEMKGYDAVPVIKAISPGVPVIVTATQNSPEQEARIRQQDVFYYYVKGFDIHELQMAVDDALIMRMERAESATDERV